MKTFDDDIEYIESLENQSLDILYIDTLHTFAHMDYLLEVCYPKMKHGSLLFGHDYTPEFYGVVEAVTNFRFRHNLDIKGSGQDYSIWWDLIK